jgi:hypothetical protein
MIKMRSSAFWHDLEKRFISGQAKFGNALGARWIGPESPDGDAILESRVSYDPLGWEVGGDDGLSASNSAGERWYIGGTAHQHARTSFAWLAERAAVGLGHPGGQRALFFWLDRLKTKSPCFQDAGGMTRYKDVTIQGNARAGGIDRPFEASAEYCLKLATECLAAEAQGQKHWFYSGAPALKSSDVAGGQPGSSSAAIQHNQKPRGRPARTKEHAQIAEIVSKFGADWKSEINLDSIAESIDSAGILVDSRTRKRGLVKWVDVLDSSKTTFSKAIEYRLNPKKSR